MRGSRWVHVLGVAVVLGGLLPLLATGGVVSADEGAMLAQLELLERAGSWTLPNPEPVADPDMESLPLELSERSEEGRWAPYAKHVAHITLLRPAYALGGRLGALVMSLAGVVLAAACAGWLAERVRPGSGALAVWLTGIGSPLLFDGYQVVGHALGAGLIGLVAVGVVRSGEATSARGHVSAVLATGTAALAAGLVRSEAVLAGLAVAVACIGCGLWRRGRGRARRTLRAGVSAGLGALGALALDAALLRAALGSASIGTAGAVDDAGTDGFLQGRWSGFRITVLDPGYGVDKGDQLLLLASLVALATAMIWSLRRSVVIVRFMASVSAALGFLWLLTADFLVPGLLPAMPLLAVGVVLLRRPDLHDGVAPWLLPSGILFFVAVVATQYSTGGSGEWGGRYFAVGLPLVVPLGAAGLVRMWSEMPIRDRSGIALCAAVLTLSISIGAVRATEGATEASEEVSDFVFETTTMLDPDITVSTSGAVSRFAWDWVLDGRRSSTVSGQDLDALTSRLATDGAARVALVSRDIERDRRALEQRWDFEVVGEMRRTTVALLTPRP